MFGIIGAMQSEITLLLGNMKNTEKIQLGKKVFYKGTIEGQEVVLTESGMGKVNAAICAQILIDIFKVDYLINTGIAGGLHKDMHVADFAIGDSAVEYDIDLTPIGAAKGWIMGEDRSKPTVFHADSEMVKLFEKAALTVLPEGHVFTGRIATGDIFVNTKELKKELIETYNAVACEMEGGAIMHTANENDVKCIVIRAISDLANDDSAESVSNFEQVVADRSANILLSFLKNF